MIPTLGPAMLVSVFFGRQQFPSQRGIGEHRNRTLRNALKYQAPRFRDNRDILNNLISNFILLRR
jgi:IS30 family transposase